MEFDKLVISLLVLAMWSLAVFHFHRCFCICSLSYLLFSAFKSNTKSLLWTLVRPNATAESSETAIQGR